MKAKCIFTVIGFVALMACKKEKVEPVTEIKKSDTVVTNPPYWCVKSAVLNNKLIDRNLRYEFEYDNQSLLKAAKVIVISLSNKDTLQIINHAYKYEGKKLIYRKSIKNDSLLQEEFRTYIGDRIESVQINGYEYSSGSTVYTRYEYKDNAIKSKTISKSYFVDAADTICTIHKDYPDSSIVEIDYIWRYISKDPTYHFKERLIKSTGLVTMSGSIEKTDSTTISKQRNSFNPIIWDLFDLNYYHPSFAPFKVKAVLLDREFNSYFVNSMAFGVYLAFKDYNQYYYDTSGRMNKITFGLKLSYNGEEPAFPIELNLTY